MLSTQLIERRNELVGVIARLREMDFDQNDKESVLYFLRRANQILHAAAREQIDREHEPGPRGGAA